MSVMAVLGLGEAGGRIAADLASSGVDVRAYDPAVATVPAGVTRVADPAVAVAESSIVLVLTTASSALSVAESVLPALAPGAVYADLNTAAPALKREVAVLVAEAGGRFADVALLAPVPDRGLGTRALASGPGAQAFADAHVQLGMPGEVLSGDAGDAAACKLLRSVFMKGLAASVLESLHAAEVAGRASWLREQIAAVVSEPLLERLVAGSRLHATRRVDELHAARDLLLELGVEPHVTDASAAVLRELATTGER